MDIPPAPECRVHLYYDLALHPEVPAEAMVVL